MLKVRTTAEKWRFVVAITGGAVLASILLTWIMQGGELITQSLQPSILVPLLIAPPVTLWSANRMLEIHRLNQQLEHLLAHDQMTNLLSRSHFMRRLDEMSSDFKGSVLMLDIDFFKQVNDTYGHLVGDEVIRRVAEVIETHVRQDSLAARYGGEEFVVCLPQKDLDEAMGRAEQIRRAVENQTVSVSGQDLRCTISIGLGYADGEKPLVEVLRKADEALYLAKNQGRNRVGTPHQTPQSAA
ncbi:MAG: diguanylate cyclase [Rhodobacteraceae bacterium]|nr:diguanylate cyclase [Paracoccaceae bacterium]